MKRLILLFTLVVPLLAGAQSVPQIETTIDTEKSYSFTDAQLRIEEKLTVIANKYWKGYEQGDNYGGLSEEEIQWIERTFKVDFPKDDNVELSQWLETYDWLENSQPYGCSWYCGAMHFETVSSSLPAVGKNDYSAESIFDDDVRTAWVPNSKCYGIGESVEVHFPVGWPRATVGYIVNGYNKDEKTWRENSRVKTMNLYEDDRLIGILNLKDTRDMQRFILPDTIPNLKDTTRFKMFHHKESGSNFEEDYRVSTLKFLITDVYPGDKYEDTAISELFFDGLGVHCLAEGTQVTLANSSKRNIEDVRVGDNVLGYADPVFSAVEVTNVHAVKHATMYKVTLEDGRTITVTDDHPFLSEKGWRSINPSKTKSYDRYKDRSVSTLAKGDTVKALTEGSAVSSEVVGIERISEKTMTYTLELENDSAFVANGLFVGRE